MKKVVLIVFNILCISGVLFAQGRVVLDSLPIIYLKKQLSVHLVCPENIKYVEISSGKFRAEIPIKNIVRIRAVDSLSAVSETSAVVTIVGETSICQYRIYYAPFIADSLIAASIDIPLSLLRPIDPGSGTFSESKLKKLALGMLSGKVSKGKKRVDRFGIRGTLNSISTYGDYIFIDISYHNATNLKFDISQLRFSLIDKKMTKASNIQSIEVIPEVSLFEHSGFKTDYRNIFIFKKFTFPGNKLLQVEMSEKQLSGRNINLSIKYSEILKAGTLAINQ